MDPATFHLFVSSSGARRIEAVEAFLCSLDPGREALLVGATRDAADDVARDLALRRDALFGVYRTGWRELITRLAIPSMANAGLAPASSLGAEAVAARAAFDALEAGEIEALRDVSRFPGFSRALARTLGELRLAEISAEAPEWPEDEVDLRELMRRFDRELERAGIVDRAMLTRFAMYNVETEAPKWIRGLPLVLLDVPADPGLERRFLSGLMSMGSGGLATIPEGDEPLANFYRESGALSFEMSAWETPESVERNEESESRDVPEEAGVALDRLRRHLFEEGTGEEGDADSSVVFFSAPGEGRECLEITRQILGETREGRRLDAMAVFLRSPELYSGHLETAFRRAGVPAYFARGTKRPDPSGRAFLSLLACRSEGYSARRFAEYLSFGQVPELGDDGAPPTDRDFWAPPDDESFGSSLAAPRQEPSRQLSLFETPAEEAERGGPDEESHDDHEDRPTLRGTLRAPWKWEEYLVEASVIGGYERWVTRLRGLENELRLKGVELADDEPESPRLEAIRRDLINLRHLERFALPVVDALAKLPARAPWGEWLVALNALAPMVLREPTRVLTVLAELQPMAEVGPVDIEEVRVVLSERLTFLEKERSETRHGAVFVGTPEQARGRRFDVVFVPGLAERVFPQRPREDPLLLDRARRSLSGSLRSQTDRARDERLLLRLAVGAARVRVVLSYPRVDVVEARPRVPSFYGLDVARAVRGYLPDHQELERDAAATANARLAWPAPDDADEAIDAVEHDLAVLFPLIQGTSRHPQGRARYLLELNPFLARSLRTRWVRWQKKWGPQDGIVRATKETQPILLGHRPTARPYSITALEKFAACPYRFLLSAIHRLEPREDAVALIQLDPLTRGRMIHEIQARTLRRLRDEKRLPVRTDNFDEAEVVLEKVSAQVSQTYAEELAPAIPRIWEDEVNQIRGDLRLWLRAIAEDLEWVPRYFEFTFGLPKDEGYDPASRKDPVRIEGKWRLRGAVDLIEARAHGDGFRVTDHKTGRNYTKDGWVVGGGETLQPVLYAFAVEAALKDEVTDARLWFCTSRGAFGQTPVLINDFARLYGRQVLQTVDDAISEGRLPPAPREGACKYCDFRTVCGPYEEARVKKKDSKLLKALNEVRGLP